jgi:peptidoglycan/xylan/chitin deacetylase (PgdA/CDA1 family)
MSLLKYCLTLLVILSYNCHASCSLKWGQGKIKESTSHCLFKSGKSKNPSYLVTKVARWDKSQNIYITIKVKNARGLKGVRFDFLKANTTISSYEMPLFKDVDFNLVQEQAPVTFSIPSSQLSKLKDNKIDHIGIYLNTDFQKEVTFEIIKIKSNKKIHQGRISLTFDDGYTSNLKAAMAMKIHKMKATAYVIPSTIGKNGYLKWSDISQLETLGWSISAHMKTPLTQINIKKLTRKLKINKNQILKRIKNKQSSAHFALPLGKHNSIVINKVKNIFKSNRLASGGIESLPPADKYRLRVINVLESTSPEKLFKLAQGAIAHNEWAIFMFHYIDRPEKKELNYSLANYKIFVKLIAPLNKKIMSINEVIKEIE